MNCKNCNQTAGGNFCAHCGQSTKVDKINLPNFLRELSEGVFQINRGFFFTLKELFVRPGYSIRAYLEGRRKSHFKPIAYALTWSTIYFILSQFTESGTIVNDFIKGYTNGLSLTEAKTNQLATLEWLAKNYAYTTLLLLPLYALASYIAFSGSGFNYLEHIVLNAYITGQQAIFYSLAAILSFILKNEDLIVTVTLIISVTYALFVFWQFFSRPGRVAVVFRSLLTYVLSLVMTALVLFVIFLIVR